MLNLRPHGANPEKLYATLGICMPERVLDFSTNVNAVPQRSGFAPDLSRMLEQYPDDSCTRLKSALASANGVAECSIAVTAGANEAISILASLGADQVNAIVHPAYGEYARALAGHGAPVVGLTSLSENLLPSQGTVWCCNPCNPTGELMADEAIVSLARTRPEMRFIIDESYRDFIWTSPLPFSDVRTDPPNLIRIRSLTKILNLCGIRIAYVLADGEMIRLIEARRPHWSVTSLAQEAALYRLGDTTLFERTRAYYAAEMPRLIQGMAVAGFSTMQTHVNFVLMRTDDDERLIRFLLQRGMVVRHTRNFCGLDGRYVRIAAKTQPDDDRLLAALRAYR